MLLNENNLIIGTANYTKEYGFNKSNLSKKSFLKICDEYIDQIPIHLDLALRYNNIDEIFINSQKYKFKVNLKISSNINKSLFSKILNRFYGKESFIIDTVMFHDEIFEIDKNTIEIMNLLNLKNIKFGISFYDLRKIEKYAKELPLKIIQVPFNIFDQRLLNSEIISIVKEYKLKVHARSIFLQGLLLKLNENIKSRYFKKWEKNFFKLDKFCKYNNIECKDLCLSFALQTNIIDKFVIGFDNFDQFNDLFKKKFKLINKNLNEHRIDDENLINPYLWQN